jgi:hypothetical protein
MSCVLLMSCARPAHPDKPSINQSKVARTQVDRGPVSVTVEVSPEPARLSDEPQLTVIIRHEPGVVVRLPPFGDSVGAFIVRDFREPLPETDGTRQILRQIYTLEPTQAGPLQIDPFIVVFTDKRSHGDGKEHRIETEALTVNILSSLDKHSPSLAQLKTAQDPIPLPSPAPSRWWLAGGGIALIFAVVVWLLLHRRARKPILLPSPRELAARELVELWQSNSAQAEVKLFYVELTGIVRRYIERTSHIHAPEQTTEEFLREIAHTADFNRNDRQRLKDFLEAADLVKFAGYRPVYQDVEESYRRAKVFVGLVPNEESLKNLT